VANHDFGLPFFPRSQVRISDMSVMPATKAPDTFRIFIFGESAAMGDPRPNFGAGCYLEVLLAERFPQTKFELINTSTTAINSHVILPIARECARHSGDLWLIYIGNNEMVGPFGAATVFGARAPPLGWSARKCSCDACALVNCSCSDPKPTNPTPSLPGVGWKCSFETRFCPTTRTAKLSIGISNGTSTKS
jgi:hypothetical protein